MKKLFYTLFAFALIVACEKDMDENYDSSSINPIEAEVAIDYKARFDAFNDFLRGADITPSKEVPSKESASTARGGQNGPDWVELIWFAQGSEHYVYTRPDDLGNACYDNIGSGVSNIYRETYSYRAATQMVHIQVAEDAGAEFAIPADLQALYASAFLDVNAAIYFANLDGTTWTFQEGALPTGTSFNFDCAGTPGTGTGTPTFDWRLIAGSTDMYENTNPAITATYRLSPAPFPLTGMLATIVTADSDNASANYAGTSSSTVRDAIEDDIEGL